MAKETDFTIKVDSELHTEFLQEADAEQRPVETVVRELMQEYVAERREAREYSEFLRRKIERAREDIKEGRTIPHAEVEAEFAIRRNGILGNRR